MRGRGNRQSGYKARVVVIVLFVGALVNKNWTEKIKICTTKTKIQTDLE